jgi:cardiolipin synthase
MDRRSFELNYENNILLYDPLLTLEMRKRQDSYIANAHRVSSEMVASRSWRHKLWYNAIAMFGPVL